MLSENIRTLRRLRGMSQEDLSSRLHVVRQTVSKWEKGLSVPDADLLQKMAEVFETDAAALLGAPAVQERSESEMHILAQELANINAQLAEKNRRSRRIWRTVAGVLIAIAAIYILLVVLGVAAFRSLSVDTYTESTYSEVYEEQSICE